MTQPNLLARPSPDSDVPVTQRSARGAARRGSVPKHADWLSVSSSTEAAEDDYVPTDNMSDTVPSSRAETTPLDLSSREAFWVEIPPSPLSELQNATVFSSQYNLLNESFVKSKSPTSEFASDSICTKLTVSLYRACNLVR